MVRSNCLGANNALFAFGVAYGLGDYPTRLDVRDQPQVYAHVLQGIQAQRLGVSTTLDVALS